MKRHAPGNDQLNSGLGTVGRTSMHHGERETALDCIKADRLLTFKEALGVLGLSRSSAYRLLKQDALPRPIKIGALNFFSELELQSWIAGKLAARDQGGEHD